MTFILFKKKCTTIKGCNLLYTVINKRKRIMYKQK